MTGPSHIDKIGQQLILPSRLLGKFAVPWSFILTALMLLCICCRPYEKQEVLTIATAANMQYAMADLAEAFRVQTGTTCRIVISSSGKLSAQIKQGAPYDIFIAADSKYPLDIYQNDMALAKPRIYAFGRLIIWSQKSDLPLNHQVFLEPMVRHIAIANPQTAPYGLAAQAFLENTGLWPLVQEKLVFGESISQTNQFIVSQAAQIGLTGQSVVFATDSMRIGHWVYADTNYYEPIAQSVVILKGRPQTKQAAIQFQSFLFSSEGEEILKSYGYLLHHDAEPTSI